MKELLLKVLALCYEISTTTKADVFFVYHPHCNYYSVRYNKDGWDENDETIYINLSTEINIKNLKITLEKLEKLKSEVKQ